VRGPGEQLSVECHPGSRAGTQPEGGSGTEAGQLHRELVARHADAVSRIRPLRTDEDDPPVGELADRAPGLPGVAGTRIERLVRVEDGSPVLHEERTSPDRRRLLTPVRGEREPDSDLLAGRRLRLELGD